MDVELIEAGAALRERFEHHDARFLKDAADAGDPHARRDRLGVHAGSMERFVRIDVADPAHHGLVHEHRLECGAGPLDDPCRRFSVPVDVEGVAGDVGAAAGHCVRAVLHQIIHPDVAEDPLIEEAQFAQALCTLQCEHGAGMAVELILGRVDAELSAHPQMQRQRR